MSKTGQVIFDNLALLFAMGVAISMARKEKEVAALSGAIAFWVMNMTISALIEVNGGVSAIAANSTDILYNNVVVACCGSIKLRQQDFFLSVIYCSFH